MNLYFEHFAQLSNRIGALAYNVQWFCSNWVLRILNWPNTVCIVLQCSRKWFRTCQTYVCVCRSSVFFHRCSSLLLFGFDVYLLQFCTMYSHLKKNTFNLHGRFDGCSIESFLIVAPAVHACVKNDPSHPIVAHMLVPEALLCILFKDIAGHFSTACLLPCSTTIRDTSLKGAKTALTRKNGKVIYNVLD